MESAFALGKWQKLRSLLWPIYGKEHRIWFPMALIIGLILFNYNISRNMKDSLVVIATGEAMIIPFLKLGLVLPASVIFFFIFAKLAEYVHHRSLFYIVVSGFLIFYLLFAFVLYPFHEYLHPKTSADFLQSLLPVGFKGLVDCYRVWTFSFFYIASELWGVIMGALLFWQFANEVISVDNAKRFYPHFYMLANILVAFSGILVSYIASAEKFSSADHWNFTVRNLCLLMMFSGVVILFLYGFLDKKVFKVDKTSKLDKNNPSELSLSVKESIKHIFQSPYLGLIAVLVICYGITVNLIELAWKRQLGIFFKTGDEYVSFMAYLSTATATASILWIFIGSIVLRKTSWRAAALLTPVTILVMGSLFFFSVLFPQTSSYIAESFGVTPLFFTVILGFVLEVFMKSIKYALFDSTKEMAYIPLDEESKLVGKAAVDVVASRLGKSSGGFLEIFIVVITGSLTESLGIFSCLFLLFSIIWIMAVFGLYPKFVKACEKNQVTPY